MAAVIGPGTPCSVCQENFVEKDKIVNASGRVWHDRCFVLVNSPLISNVRYLFRLSRCVQCFRPFKDDPFFEVGIVKICVQKDRKLVTGSDV
jgi:hypothetical protein